MSIFKKATFFTTVNHIKDLPDTDNEIAIVGRSNAGKSSLLNTLCNHHRLAFVSKTPGRTQHINFFDLQDNRYLVDLPGYGYAKVPDAVRTHWTQLLGRYLETRPSLRGLILVSDIRHPLKESDWAMINFFKMRHLPIHIILSKSDKLSKEKQKQVLNEVKKTIVDLEQCTIQTFSSSKKEGIAELETHILPWFPALDTVSQP
jgi:GTP-binding protein